MVDEAIMEVCKAMACNLITLMVAVDSARKDQGSMEEDISTNIYRSETFDTKNSMLAVKANCLGLMDANLAARY